jgi:tetratricopeptide (TPR) repeat protein
MKRINKKFDNKIPLALNESDHSHEIAALLLEADEYFDTQKWKQANVVYQKIIEIESSNTRALNGLGLIAMELNMLSLAVDFFNMASEVNAKDLFVNKNLAVAYTRMSRFSDAVLQYLLILDIDENNVDAHGELARLNLQAGNAELALHHCKYALNLDSEEESALKGIVSVDSTVISVADGIDRLEK